MKSWLLWNVGFYCLFLPFYEIMTLSKIVKPLLGEIENLL